MQRLATLAAASVVVTVVAVVFGAYALAVSGQRYAALDAGMDSVVVAVSDLGSGQVVTADQIAVREMPITAIPDGALRDASHAVGKTVLAPVAGGGILSERVLAGESAGTLAGRIDDGRVAVSITVNQQSGIAGLVHQGDEVCVLGTGHAAQDASAVIVARHARVLALDAQLDAYDDAYTAITLEVSLDEAESIATALSVGQVSCALEPASQTVWGKDGR